MKAFNLLFGIIFTVSSVYGQQTVTIEGDIQNMPDSLTIGCREMKGESMQLYTDDLFSMVNGKFKITKEVSQTTRMFLHINNTGYEFWVKPGANIKITGSAPYIQTWQTKSDIPIPEQIELNRFRAATREENIRIHDLTQEFMKQVALGQKDSVSRQKRNALRLQANSIHDQDILYKELLLMLDNPITTAGLQELRDAAKCFQAGKFNDKALIVSVFDKLTDEQKQSVLGKEISSLLTISSTVKEGDPIADAELKDIAGNIHHLSDYKGQYILLDFWSRVCGPCVAAPPELETIAKQYKGKVVVVSLSVDIESVWKEECKRSVDNWLQLSDGLGMSGLAAHYGVRSLPTFVYISPEGTILQIKSGYRDGALIEDIKELISNKQTN